MKTAKQVKKGNKKSAKRATKVPMPTIDVVRPVVKELIVRLSVRADGTEDISLSSPNGAEEIPRLVRKLRDKLVRMY